MGLTHSPRIVTNGLVLCLDAANVKSYPGTGTTWTNLSGSGNNGTLTNGPTFSSDNKGSLVFDGTNDHANLGSSNNLTGNNLQTLTVSIWLKYSTTTFDTRAFTLQRGSSLNSSLLGIYNNADSTIQVNTTGSLGFFTRNFNNTSHAGLVFNDNYHLKNRFINVQCVVDGMNRYLYIDGILKNSDSDVGIQSVTNNTDPVYVGSGPTGNSNFWNGSIGNIMFYRRALTAAEIQQNFNALRGRYGI